MYIVYTAPSIFGMGGTVVGTSHVNLSSILVATEDEVSMVMVLLVVSCPEALFMKSCMHR